MRVGFAIIVFVISHILLRAWSSEDAPEFAIWFWPFLLSVGVYLAIP